MAAGLLTVTAPAAEARPTGMASRVHVKVHEWTLRQATERKAPKHQQRKLSRAQRNKIVGHTMVHRRGWSHRQWHCLRKLWTKESGWNQRAHNGGSGAHGIPQALPGSKMRSAGRDWRTNPKTQIRWGLRYIKHRYGSPCSAWAHWGARNWY